MNKTGLFFTVILFSQCLLIGNITPALGMNDSENPVEIHGFISQGFLKSNQNNFFADTSEGTLEFNEMGINFSSELTPELSLGIQFFARDLGSLSNDEIIVDWAFADYHYNDMLGLRVGSMKNPLGLYNKIRDMDMLRTNIILPQSVYNEAWRDVMSVSKGFQLYGTVNNDFLGRLHYQGQVGIFGMEAESGVSYTIEDNVPTPLLVDVKSNDIKRMNVASLFWDTPVEGLRLGQTFFDTKLETHLIHQRSVGVQVDPVTKEPVEGLDGQMVLLEWSQVGGQGRVTDLATGATGSGAVFVDPETGFDALLVTEQNSPYFMGAFGKIATDGAAEVIKIKTTNLVSFAEYTFRDLVLAFEYARQRYYLKLGPLPAEKFYSLGYYGSAVYRFNQWFELGTYYSEYYRDEKDKDGKKSWETPVYGKHRSWLKDAAVSTRFDLNDYWTLKFEFHLMDGAAWLLNSDNLGDDSTPHYDRYWSLFAAKVNYRF